MSADLEPYEPDDEDVERWRSMIREPLPPPSKQNRLAELEGVVERGLGTFLEVGAALMMIKSERLYKATHSTWDDYCRDRWSISGRHGFRMIEAAKTAEESATHGSPIPENERQARALAHPPKPVEPSKPEALPPAPSRAQNPPSSSGPERPIGVQGGRSPLATYAASGDPPPPSTAPATQPCPTCNGTGRIPIPRESHGR